MNATPSYLMDKIVKLNENEKVGLGTLVKNYILTSPLMNRIAQIMKEIAELIPKLTAKLNKMIMDKLANENKIGKVNLETLRKKYRLTLDLAYASLRDPLYYTDLIKILKELQEFFEKFIPENDVKEDMRFAYNVIKQFNVTLVRELEKIGPIISIYETSDFVKTLSKWIFKTILEHAEEIHKHSSLSSDSDIEVVKILRSTIKEFYNAIHRLNIVYNNNFYVQVKSGIVDVEREINKAKQHVGLDKELKLLYQIKARLIQECYFHIEAAIEGTRPYREKLEIISEFNVFKLVLKDPEINEILISELTTGLREINEPLENFIKTVNDLIKQGKETEKNEKLLCEISKPVLSAIISLVDYVIFKFESEEERDMLLDQISENFVKPSLDLFRVSKAKAILSDINGQYRFSVECIREATSYFDMRYLFECKTDPHTLKEFLEKEKFGLKEYIEYIQSNNP